MTEQQTAVPLAMVSIPADPMPVTYPSEPDRPNRYFGALRLTQKFGWLVALLLLVLASYFGFNHFVLRSVKVIGVSMVPTLQENEHYLLNIWALRRRDPQHNDIVVLRDPGDHGLAVKRIIAVAGESVFFKNGQVYVNGKELSEPYLFTNTHTFTYSQAKEQFITCGKDQYFVMGDNRIRSIDSRAYGTVSRSDIYGLVETK